MNTLDRRKTLLQKSFLLFGNMALLFWASLSFFGTWLFNQIYGWILLLFTATAIYLILRRLGCSSCYLCKSCNCGFGILAGAFFGTGYLKKGSIGNRIGLIASLYFLLSPLPMSLLILSIIQSFTLFKILAFTGILILSAASFSTWIKKIKY